MNIKVSIAFTDSTGAEIACDTEVKNVASLEGDLSAIIDQIKCTLKGLGFPESAINEEFREVE